MKNTRSPICGRWLSCSWGRDRLPSSEVILKIRSCKRPQSGPPHNSGRRSLTPFSGVPSVLSRPPWGQARRGSPQSTVHRAIGACRAAIGVSDTSVELTFRCFAGMAPTGTAPSRVQRICSLRPRASGVYGSSSRRSHPSRRCRYSGARMAPRRFCGVGVPFLAVRAVHAVPGRGQVGALPRTT